MQTVSIEQALADNLKLEFNTSNVKEAIQRLYSFYVEAKKSTLDIEVISENDPDYHLVLKGREEYLKHPERFGTMNDIDWK